MTVCRSIGSSFARALPPFVGCEQFWVDTVGNPPHPARGFQKITLLLKGKLKIEYSPPNTFMLEPMDVLSVMIGRGVRPKLSSVEGTSMGVHIWVDVPERYKRCSPTSEFSCAKGNVTFVPSSNVEVTLLSGEAFGHKANQSLTLTPVTLMYVTVRPGAVFEFEIPDHWNAFLYTTQGNGVVNNSLKMGERHYVEFSGRPKRDASELAARVEATEPLSFIFGAAMGLDQPIYHQGPFVDVSSDWIDQAYDDYNKHRNGFEKHQMWNDHMD